MAQSEQLYFVGMEARVASLSGEGGASTGVYLRWDPVEGEVPSDVQSFLIKRDGQQLATLPASDVLSAGKIAELYQGAAQSRRLAEMLSSLDRNASGQRAQAELDGSQVRSCFAAPVGLSNFAQLIHAQIDPGDECYNSFWAAIASRTDFNVARARNRGYLDTTVSASGTSQYELVAVSTTDQEAVVGRIDVEVDGKADRLPAAADFERRLQARCDGPERFKDHGSLALYWDFSSANVTERMRDALLTAGFDLYRSSEATEAKTGDDIRVLAQSSLHGGEGELSLPNLVRVNSRPILVSGAPDAGSDGVQRETRYEGWNAPFVQYVDSPESLAAAGVLPGEYRNYYLVARDFSGNYGDTAEIRVRIPDTIAPPAPWDVRTELDSYDDAIPTLMGSLELVWDHVDTRNYHTDHQNARSYCNLDTARFDKKLIYAPGEASCEDAGLREVDLDVHQYIVYRFDSPAAAQAFADSDGDGRSDDVERDQLAGPPKRLSAPGTACDASAAPGPPALDYRVSVIDLDAGPGPSDDWQIETAPDGRKVIRWRDTDINGPAGVNHAGEVFWYVLAAMDAAPTDGKDPANLSPLSAPIRAHFPDRARPDREGIRCGRRGDCWIEAHALGKHDSNLPFAVDNTEGGKADFVRVGCQGSLVPGTPYWQQGGSVEYRIEDPNPENGLSVRGAPIDEESCLPLAEVCSGKGAAYVEFHNDEGTLLDAGALPYTVTYSESFYSCPNPESSQNPWLPNAILEEHCEDRPLLSLQPGEALDEAPVCEPPPGAPDACITVYRRLGEQRLKWKTFCDLNEFTLDVPHVGSEPVCLSLTLQNENNVASAHLHLPCFSLPSAETIEAPQPLGITFQGERARLGWLPPQQHVVGTLLQWRRSGGEESGVHFFPHAGHISQDGPLYYDDVEIGQAPGAADPHQEWCFRARSVGPDKASGPSPWSAEVCDLRLLPGETPPTYLPWPAIQVPGEIDTLEAVYLPHEGLPAVLISDSPELGSLIFAVGSGIFTDCLNGVGNPPCLADVPADLDVGVRGYGEEFCSTLRKSAEPLLGFVAYRQSREGPSDVPSEFQQVSPLVDRLNCSETVQKNTSPLLVAPEIVVGELADPLMKLTQFSNASSFHTGQTSLLFIDRSPHEVHENGPEYRYQFVYFGDDGEIVGYRTTNWLIAEEGS